MNIKPEEITAILEKEIDEEIKKLTEIIKFCELSSFVENLPSNI